MINKHLLATTFAALSLFAACKDKKTTTSTPEPTATPTAVSTNNGIVFINIDTLMTKYDYYKDSKKRIEGRIKSMQSELESRSKSIQNEYEGYQKKGETMSPKEIEAAQKSLGEKQQKVAEYKNQVETSIAKEQEQLDKLLREKINDYIAKVSKENNYQFVLTYNYSGIGMLYGDPSKDITEKTLTDLNEMYKQEKDKK